ncbi:unnamed protein product [Anisakis simplex]|uniref:SSD domain-containing protein n=1 Tax=Anisakis simplex TaxID=6269 RepID=A0A0M3K313_ANISI|nr:unnamed protein product [Anisakis simplex]
MSSAENTTPSPTLCIRLLTIFFRLTGHVVAKYPGIVIAVVMVFTIVFSVQVPMTKMKDDFVNGYTLKGVRSLTEVQAYQKFNHGHYPIVLFILAAAKDGGSMMRLSHLNATVDIIDDVGSEFAVKNKSFDSICESLCDINEPVPAVRFRLTVSTRLMTNLSFDKHEIHHPLIIFQRLQTHSMKHHIGIFISSTRNAICRCALHYDCIETELNFQNGYMINYQGADSILDISYPVSRIVGRQVDLSANLFGVDTYDDYEMQTNNASSNIKDLKLILLQFRAQRPSEWNVDDVMEWERKVSHHYLFKYNNPYIKPMVYSFVFAQDEIARTGRTMFPYIAIGLLVISVFSLVTVYISATYTNQWSVHKIVYAITAGVCPLLATSTALGLIFCLGVRFSSILCMTPFLTLAIGVDDSYLLINAWLRISRRQNELAVKTSLEERIVDMFIDVGPSMTITSVTNVVAFAIGAFTPIDEIRILCVATSLSISFAFLYTITLYAAVMTLCASREIINEKTSANDRALANQRNQKLAVIEGFLNGYCDWLSNGYTSIFMLLILCPYWYLSITGAMTAQARLSIDRLFLEGSPMLEVNHARQKYVLPSYTCVTIYVNRAGDLFNKTRIARIKQMVNEFEQLPDCNGAQFSHFWIRDYENYLKFTSEEFDEDTNDSDADSSAFSTESIRQFIEWPEYKYWQGFMRFDETTSRMKSFLITVAYHGEHLADWTERLNILKRWRSIVDRYQDLEATVYEDEALYSEQIDHFLPITIQTSLVTFLCMAIVCFVFMPNFFTLFVAVGAITSIFIGVFGFVTHWGVDVDSFSMAALIMSIGLSVDFPAHITYHYHRSGYDSSLSTSKERIKQCLIAIGFPLLQCSGSTVLFVLCLAFIPCYMSAVSFHTHTHYCILFTLPRADKDSAVRLTLGETEMTLIFIQVFIKTITLVMSLGIIHALIVVPVFLCTLTNIHKRYSTWQNFSVIFFWNDQLIFYSFVSQTKRKDYRNHRLINVHDFQQKMIKSKEIGKEADVAFRKCSSADVSINAIQTIV